VSWLVCHIVSGDAFISGLLFVAAGLALIWLRRTKGGQLAGRVLLIVGWILTIAGPDPRYTFEVVAALCLSAWSFAASLKVNLRRRADSKPDGTASTRYSSMIGISLVFALLMLEAPGYPQPALFNGWWSGEPIHVIGDSLSAGIGAGEGEPWPSRLAAILGSEVVSHAQAGATAKSAIEQAEQLSADSFVIVEIGGNDLLGGRSAAEFEQDLDQLLTKVCSDGRRVVMFELPLPPFYLRFGEAQHKLARNHGVTLIPRRVLARVLFSEAATLDSIHLSETGHRRLAEEVAARLKEGAAPK